MKELYMRLNTLLKATKGDLNIPKTLMNGKNVYPFSIEGDLLAYYLSIGEISYKEYLQIKSEYHQRNKYLDLFDMAPRTYGQTWGETHILNLFPEFTKATKENLRKLYPAFDGEFDLWLDGIRIEVKACRANNPNGVGGLSGRAYLRSEAIASKFQYHYQQLKPSCCDVFIWIGTCRDELIYWVLTSEELRKTGELKPQHRNENTGVAGKEIFEGQVWMTEEQLRPFIVNESDILEKVREKGKK